VRQPQAGAIQPVEVARAVQMRAKTDRVFAIARRWDIGPCSLLAGELPDPIRVVSTICGQHRLRKQRAEKNRTQLVVVRLAGRQSEMDRQATLVSTSAPPRHGRRPAHPRCGPICQPGANERSDYSKWCGTIGPADPTREHLSERPKRYRSGRADRQHGECHAACSEATI
jgi:hypothetical protein